MIKINVSKEALAFLNQPAHKIICNKVNYLAVSYITSCDCCEASVLSLSDDVSSSVDGRELTMVPTASWNKTYNTHNYLFANTLHHFKLWAKTFFNFFSCLLLQCE